MTRRESWDKNFWRNIANGMDHMTAAYQADQAEKQRFEKRRRAIGGAAPRAKS